MNEALNKLIELAEQIKKKTIFDIFDSCIEKAEAPIDKNFFIHLKAATEEELKTYAATHNVSSGLIMNNHKVIRTENGLEIKSLSEQITILKIYFPSEFNPNSIIMMRC